MASSSEKYRRGKPKNTDGIVYDNRTRYRTPRSTLEELRFPRMEGREAVALVDDWRDAIRRAEALRQSANDGFQRLRELQEQARSQSGNPTALQETRAEMDRLTKLWLRDQYSFAEAQGQIAKLWEGEEGAHLVPYEATITGPDGQETTEERQASVIEVLHRKYMQDRLQFYNFQDKWQELGLVMKALRTAEPVVFGGKPLTPTDQRVAAYVAEERDTGSPHGHKDIADDLREDLPAEQDQSTFLTEQLAQLFPEGQRDDVVALMQGFLERQEEQKSGKLKVATGPEQHIKDLRALAPSELRVRRDVLLAECEDLWENRSVRNAWFLQYFDKLVSDSLRGERVLELPSTIEHLNQLARWENDDPESVVGGVLVGPPGVGKSTLVEKYLRARGRKEPVQIDMSQEVTRYMLFGSPSTQIQTELGKYQEIATSVKEMDDKQLLQMLEEHAEKLIPAMGNLSDEECLVAAGNLVAEELAAADATAGVSVDGLRQRLLGIAEGAVKTEVAKKLADITKKNGWRDGVIIHGMRTGRSVIVDEFNANSGWTLMNNLLTTKKQGKDGRGRYWFADNNEWIDIPEDWHVYFTANIGRQYGRAAIRPDFGSRIGSKVTEVQNPPKEDEWLLAGVKMCDPKRNIVLDAKSQYQLGVFILEALPSIRELMRSSSETSFPISFRVLEDILKKLINYSGGVPRAREGRTVDSAVLESVLRPYKLWESRELPKQIALQLIERGLLLDPSIEKEVIAISGLTAAELAEKRKLNEGIDPEKALQQLNDKQMSALTESPPALLAF